VYDLRDDRWLKNIKQLGIIEKRVVLTFDDGPSRQLPEILKILKEKGVQAYFFWQSKLLYPLRPWKKVIEDGHIIGSHGENHKNLTKLSYREQFQQIKGSVEKIERITGEEVQFFRPPFGQYNENTMVILGELGLTPMMWEISSYDWENKRIPEKIVSDVVDHAMDGSIILLHETKQTVKILPILINRLRDRGFEVGLIQKEE
jgi:peptidoglycan/xylan/chitin deacetylase (PgdA/CDA1 family)